MLLTPAPHLAMHFTVLPTSPTWSLWLRSMMASGLAISEATSYDDLENRPKPTGEMALNVFTWKNCLA
jgi:hypothetical protein